MGSFRAGRHGGLGPRCFILEVLDFAAASKKDLETPICLPDVMKPARKGDVFAGRGRNAEGGSVLSGEKLDVRGVFAQVHRVSGVRGIILVGCQVSTILGELIETAQGRWQKASPPKDGPGLVGVHHNGRLAGGQSLDPLLAPVARRFFRGQGFQRTPCLLSIFRRHRKVQLRQDLFVKTEQRLATR